MYGWGGVYDTYCLLCAVPFFLCRPHGCCTHARSHGQAFYATLLCSSLLIPAPYARTHITSRFQG